MKTKLRTIFLTLNSLLLVFAGCALLKQPGAAFAPTKKALGVMEATTAVACDVADLPADKRKACAQLKSAINNTSESLEKLEKVYKATAPALGLVKSGGTGGSTGASEAVLFGGTSDGQGS